MRELPPDLNEDDEELDEAEKLEQDLHDVEMIIRSRCVDVPLSNNVKVTDIGDKDKSEKSNSEE